MLNTLNTEENSNSNYKREEYCKLKQSKRGLEVSEVKENPTHVPVNFSPR